MTVADEPMGSTMSARDQALAALRDGRDAIPTSRRLLSTRQANRLDRLVDAAVTELREHGYEGLTVRAVAARCGVAPATAYTYFASKNHLVAEIYWRRLQSLNEPETDDVSPEDAVVAVMRSTVSIVSDDPKVAAAFTVAVLAEESEVRHLRSMIGLELVRRMEAALGPLFTIDLATALATHWAGAFLMAGMGFATYEQISDELDRGARALMRTR